mgnify:CR=1 FL=1
MGFKLRHTSAARMLADSGLHMSPLHDTGDGKENKPNLDEVQYFGVDSKRYQSSLADRARKNPEGYFSINTGIEGLGTQMYDKQFYKDVDGVPTLHEGYSWKDGRLTLNAPKTKDVNRNKPVSKPTQNTQLSSSGDDKKGSIGDLPTTGNLQGQDWGDVKNTTIGHGDKKATGDQELQKGPYEFVNTGTDKKSTSKENKGGKGGKGGVPDKNTNAKIVKSDSKKPNPYVKAKAKDPNLDQYIKDRNAAEKGSADYAFAQNQINKAYNIDKRHEVKLERMETKGPQHIENKMQRTVTSAMDPSFDNISSRTGRGADDRYTRMSKRQEKRTQKALGTYQKPESARQERKNLLTDMPVDKDATGGRYKNDRATKKLVKETSKQAKKDNAMAEAKAAVEAGDKKALRKSGVAGKYKRAGRQDIRAAKEAGAMDVAKAAVEAGDKKALRKSGVEGKYKRAGRQDIRAAKNLAKQKESAKQEASDLLAYSPVADREASTFDYSQSKKQNRQRYK